MAFHGPALQASPDVCDATAVDAFGVHLAEAFLSSERRGILVRDTGAFEGLDGGLGVVLIVDHPHDSVP